MAARRKKRGRRRWILAAMLAAAALGGAWVWWDTEDPAQGPPRDTAPGTEEFTAAERQSLEDLLRKATVPPNR